MEQQSPSSRRAAFWIGFGLSTLFGPGLARAQAPLAVDLQKVARPLSDTAQPSGTVIRSQPRLLIVDPSTPLAPPPSLTSAGAKATSPPQPAYQDGSLTRSGGNVRPETTRPMSVEEALETRGSVTFRKTPLSEVVFMLSDLWRINIVAGANVTGEVSGAFHDAPLREVLAAALTAGGYSYRKTGNSLVVLPADEVGTDDPSFVTETIRIPVPLQSDDSAQQAAQLLLSDRGRLQRVGESGLLVMDTAPRVAKIRQVFQELGAGAPGSEAGNADTPETFTQSGIAYFSPQYTNAEEMAEPLQVALGDQVVVATYPVENRIMVKGNANDLRLASEAIRQLDQPRPQVRITAMIYDVGLSELERLGINWGRDLRVNAEAANPALENLTGTISDAFRFNADLATSGASSVGLGVIRETIAAGAFLEALDNTSEAKLLADPSITVADRREASIRIVRRIPIVGANPVEGSNAVFTQTEFEEAGVILQVQPRIAHDGTIELKVTPEYSVVAEITNTGPVIDSREADTTVRVANGQMFVLGGLRQKSVVESQRGIPYLKDVKFVGKLFRSHDTEVRESELIVFLRPEVVEPCYSGNPREIPAAMVAQRQLDRIPYAEDVPMTPCCSDPYCPNHRPRPRINGGSESLVTPIVGPHSMYPLEQAPAIEQMPNVDFSSPTMLHDPPPRSTTQVEQTSRVAPGRSETGFPRVHVESRPLGNGDNSNVRRERSILFRHP